MNKHGMATKLGILDLAEVLAYLKEIIKSYQLGIQLGIDPVMLKTIEQNYSDIDRQKTEVVEYWLHSSPDASWTILVNAVERMGGHARLVKTLREKEQALWDILQSYRRKRSKLMKIQCFRFNKVARYL
jgi:hypothetical protein